MQTKIDNLHELLDTINNLKTDIIEGIENSVRLYINGQDDKNFVPEQSTVKLAFKTGPENIEHRMEFRTGPTNVLDTFYTNVSYNGQGLGVFRYDDGDFDKHEHIKPDVQGFILQFISYEMKIRALYDIISDVLQVKRIADTSHVLEVVGKALKHFGLAYNLVEGTTINSVVIYKEDPYDIISQNNIVITVGSSYLSTFANISLVELTKATLMGLFDKGELKVVNE